jgi:sugar phosphate isomerase/epimerase
MTQHLTFGYLTLSLPPAETIDAAAQAGFTSVGIRITGRRVHEDYTPVLRDAAVRRDIRARLADAGMRLSNVTAYHLFPEVELSHMKQVIDATAELGAGILLAHSYVPVDDRLVDLFAAYCEYAAQYDIRVACEFMRYSQVPTLEAATDWIERAGQPNAGYAIDPLHLVRSGGSVSDLAGIDPQRIVFVQLCDAAHRPGLLSTEQLLHEARNERLAPGEGDLPLREFLDALPADIEIEYEVPTPSLAHLPAAQRARIAAQRFQGFMADYARERGRPAPALVAAQ